MDYFEGFFLGPVWTDADYNEKRHPGLYLLIAFSILLFLAVGVLAPNLAECILFLPKLFCLLLGVVLLLSLPFAAARYHYIARPWRYGILLLYALQYGFFVMYLAKILLEQLIPHQDALSSYFLDSFNGMIDKGAQFFSFLGGLASNLAGIMGGVLILSLFFLAFLLLLLLLPIVYLLLIKLLQRAWDHVIIRQFYPKRLRF